MLPVALIYPNIYPVGVSNLGYQLVYSLLNAQDHILCERFVYPEHGEPLRSLESNRPLTDFPVVLGSISFEEDYPRLVALLAAGGIEPTAAARDEMIRAGSPLVVLGGVAVFMNPEPLASFADVMVIGEAEPVLADLIGLIRQGLDANICRDDMLQQIGGRQAGCYVPSLYSFEYGDTGEVTSIRHDPAVPARVRKVIACDMERASHSQLLSPDAELGMYMTELGRGCSRGCRFCAAGFIYRPPRLWAIDQVVGGLEERPPGMERIGLLGMEMADSDVLDRVSLFLEEQCCSLSFSSLRADRISSQVLSLLAKSNLKSAAIAPDGASERLRRVINKNLSEADLLSAGVHLVEAGIVNLKLYLMIGLPTETEEDLTELVELIKRLRKHILPFGRKRGRVCEVSLSVNSFVPKPWTPFQYHSYGGLDPDTAVRTRDEAAAVMALKQKIKYLRKEVVNIANFQLKVDRPERVVQQAVFARGDRRLGPVLQDMALHGYSFGRAMKKHHLSAWAYAVRPRKENELFPWDVVDHGISRQYLWKEYRKSMKGESTGPCDTSRCHRCGVCNETVSV